MPGFDREVVSIAPRLSSVPAASAERISRPAGSADRISVSSGLPAVGPQLSSQPAGSAERISMPVGNGERISVSSALPAVVARVHSERPESSERSGIYRSARPPQTLSARFWGLDLTERLPRVMSRDGVQAVAGELGRVRDFLVQSFPMFTEENLGAQPSPRMVEAKRHYLLTASDLIELQHEGRTVGVIVGAPEDWSSYYVRIFAVLPEYQRPGLTRRFGRECLFEPLADCGVERVVAETWPTNIAMSRSLQELHFHVTGHQLSERWGALVRYTKFLDPARAAAFEGRFAAALPGRPNQGRRTR